MKGFSLLAIFSLVSHILLAGAALYGESRTSLRSDWEEQRLVVSVISQVDAFTPGHRSRMQREVSESLPRDFLAANHPFSLDSSTTLTAWINDNPGKLSTIIETLRSMTLVGSSYSQEFSTVMFRFELPFFPDLAGNFINHRQGYDLPETIFHTPSADFSGILIYAQGELPVHGENREARAVPVLFPKIWDEEMNLLFESDMMDRETLLSSGPVQYAHSLNSAAIQRRIGSNPLRIIARGLFGIIPSDPIILRSDALKLLNSPKAKELLQQGRIAIVIDDVSTDE